MHAIGKNPPPCRHSMQAGSSQRPRNFHRILLCAGAAARRAADARHLIFEMIARSHAIECVKDDFFEISDACWHGLRFIAALLNLASHKGDVHSHPADCFHLLGVTCKVNGLLEPSVIE
mmetsp:Transcript_5991/g.12009  ORF Transcript_5991/g.12009 Transcript_5991/m.12009 type:complete len:119 (+) Transcript_5991:118-474(+)